MKPDLKLQKASHYYVRIRRQPELRVSRYLIVLLLLFWFLLLCTIFMEQLVNMLLMLTLRKNQSVLPEDMDFCLLIRLLVTSLSVGATFFWCRFLENRPVSTMHLTKKKILPDYLTGMLLGFAMMTVIVLAAWAFGALRYEGMQPAERPLMMLLLFAGWIIQGFSEELLFRGWLMTSIGTHHSPWTAVIFSAVNFAAVHFSNDGFSVSAVVNLMLFGIVTAIYVLRTGSLWGAAALHSIWNWAQGNFYGMQVSGIHTGTTVFSFAQTGNAKWIGGGRFGLEAGAGTTAVLLLTAVILLLLPQRFEKNTEYTEENENGTV